MRRLVAGWKRSPEQPYSWEDAAFGRRIRGDGGLHLLCYASMAFAMQAWQMMAMPGACLMGLC